MASARNLRVLDAAQQVADAVNRLLASREQFIHNAAQLRDAAGSISANIAEGFGRGAGPDRTRFLRMARGSAEETGEHLREAFAAGEIPAASYWPLHHRLVTIVRMLSRLIARPDARGDSPRAVLKPRFRPRRG